MYVSVQQEDGLTQARQVIPEAASPAPRQIKENDDPDIPRTENHKTPPADEAAEPEETVNAASALTARDDPAPAALTEKTDSPDVTMAAIAVKDKPGPESPAGAEVTAGNKRNMAAMNNPPLPETTAGEIHKAFGSYTSRGLSTSGRDVTAPHRASTGPAPRPSIADAGKLAGLGKIPGLAGGGELPKGTGSFGTVEKSAGTKAAVLLADRGALDVKGGGNVHAAKTSGSLYGAGGLASPAVAPVSFNPGAIAGTAEKGIAVSGGKAVGYPARTGVESPDGGSIAGRKAELKPSGECRIIFLSPTNGQVLDAYKARGFIIRGTVQGICNTASAVRLSLNGKDITLDVNKGNFTAGFDAAHEENTMYAEASDIFG
ncbi:MAG: hypothetical protein ABSG42_05800, partial [Nitrospirota bacterium]